MKSIMKRMNSKKVIDSNAKNADSGKISVSVDVGAKRRATVKKSAKPDDHAESGASKWMMIPNKIKSVLKRGEQTPAEAVAHAPNLSDEAKKYQVHKKRDKFVPKLVTLTSGLFERILLLRRSPFFHGVSDLELQRLSSFFKDALFVKAGTVILQEGELGDHFYVIRSGAVSITSNGIHLGVLKSPSYFGEMSLLSSVKQGATITTILDNTACLSLHKDDFNHYLENGDDRIRERLEQSLTQRTSIRLKSIPFFSPLQVKQKHGGLIKNFDEEKLSMLSSMFRYVETAEGQDIFQQGQAADSFYIIFEGKVRLWSQGPTDSEPPVELNMLDNGKWFGEDALLGQSPLCTVTATSMTRTMLLRLDRQDFVKFSECAPELQSAIQANLSVRTAEQLRTMPFFAKIKENKPWSKLALLGNLFRFQQMAAGDIVCREGEYSTGFYIIANGLCSIHVFDPTMNSDITVEELGTGQWFGEISLLLDSPRTATVTCLTDTLLCVLDQKSFRAFSNIAPELSESFNSLILHRTSNALQRFELFRHVKENKPWSKLELLAAIMQYRPEKKDVVLVGQGQAFEAIYLLSSGSVDKLIDGQAVETLRSGASIGTTALIDDVNSKATYVTASSCLFLTIHRNQFDKFAKIVPECITHLRDSMGSEHDEDSHRSENDEDSQTETKPSGASATKANKKGVTASWGSASVKTKIAILKELPLFQRLNDSEICFALTMMRAVVFQEHEQLWAQGSVAEGAFIIVEGAVRLTYRSPEGIETPLSTLNRGSIAGCYCMTNRCSHLLNAYTIRASTFAFIPKESFLKFIRILPSLQSHPDYIHSMLTTVADVLKVLPYFANLKVKEIGPLVQFDQDRLFKFASLFQFEEYPPNTQVYRIGEPSAGIYHIVSGSVSVSSGVGVECDPDNDNRLSKNDWFGDIGKSFTSTVTTKERTLLMKLPITNYPRFSEFAPEFARRVDQTVNLRNSTWLSRLAFFSGLKENKPWSKISLLGLLFQFRECQAGEVVCREGDMDRTFYIVVEGQLKVTVVNEYDTINLGTLKADDWFGEISLILDTPRTATISCLENCLLCSLTYDAFTRLRKIAPELTETFTSLILRRTVGTLKKFKLFDALRENKPWSKKELLASLLVYKSVEKDVVVFSEGDEGDHLYLIMNGTVQVTHQGMEIGTLSVGEYFGEAALLNPVKPRNASVTTLTPCLFLTISHDSFQKFLSFAPEILTPIEKLVKERGEKRRSIVMARDTNLRNIIDMNNEVDHVEAIPNSVEPKSQLDDSELAHPPNILPDKTKETTHQTDVRASSLNDDNDGNSIRELRLEPRPTGD